MIAQFKCVNKTDLLKYKKERQANFNTLYLAFLLLLTFIAIAILFFSYIISGVVFLFFIALSLIVYLLARKYINNNIIKYYNNIISYTYTFTKDQFVLGIKCVEGEKNSFYTYNLIKKIIDINSYLVLVTEDKNGYYIKKSDITEGNLEELLNFLKEINILKSKIKNKN